MHTGVDPRGDLRALALVERAQRRRGAAATRPSSARNAFRHASGIHQDGVLKWRENYEVLDPAAIGHARGHARSCSASSRGARASSRAREALGFCLSDAALDTAFDRFQRLADDQPVVEDEELRSICAAAV